MTRAPSKSKGTARSASLATPSKPTTPSPGLFPISPIPWTPHAGQKQGMRFLLEHGAAIYAADPGVGKSAVTLGAFKVLRKKKLASKLLIIAPLKVAYLVWPAEIAKWEDFADLKVVVLHGKTRREELIEDADVCVINPDGLDWLTGAKRSKSISGKVRVEVNRKRFANFGFDVLAIDECFPAGTMISTPLGPRAIETLKVGDKVSTDAGVKFLNRVISRKSALVRVTLEDGRIINVSPEHPFYTDAGWVLAKALCSEQQILSIEDVLKLRLNVYGRGGTSQGQSGKKGALLLQALQNESYVEDSARFASSSSRANAFTIFRRNIVERWQSLVKRKPGQNVSSSSSSRIEFYQTRRQWSRHDTHGNPISDDLAESVYMELRDRVGENAARISYELQSRLRQSDYQGGDRGRWEQSLSSKRPGSKKGSQISGTRVVSVEDRQQDGCQNVWNIEVEDVARYEANGCLVHNCTRFKHTTSGRFKTLKAVHDLFSRRWGLTGSLVANGLLDLFGQCYIIDQGRTFGQYITHFRSQYFVPSYSGFDWTLKKGAQEQIYERLNPLVLRQDAEDFTDLPPIVDVVHNVELPEKVRELYDSLHNDMIAKLDDNVFTIASAGAATVKLRQVANGGLYLEPDVLSLLSSATRKSAANREFISLHDEKTDVIESLMEELQGSPLLIAYDFKHDLDRLQKRFGKDLPYIGGGVSPARFKELEAAWNRGELPILLGHPQSIAHGLNLQQHGHHIAWYALTYDLELYDQFIRRIRRTGTKAQRIFNHIIVAKDTIDEQMVHALRSKDKGQKALYKALKEMKRR